MREENLRCPSCKKRLDRPVRFCYLCGTWWQHGVPEHDAVPPAPAADGPTTACPRCAYPSPEHTNFCAGCGFRLATWPIDRGEARARRQRQRNASLTPEQKDRATVRRNVFWLVAGVLVLAASIAFQVYHPGTQSAYLGPLALGLLIKLPMSWNAIKQTRERQRRRRSAQPAGTSA